MSDIGSMQRQAGIVLLENCPVAVNRATNEFFANERKPYADPGVMPMQGGPLRGR